MKNRFKAKLKKNIIKSILKEINKEYKIAKSNKHKPKYLSGYVIFDMGINSVCHFRLKSLPRWKFGIWNANNKLQFFGQDELSIDKFKPSRSPIDCNNVKDFLKEIKELVEHTHMIKHHEEWDEYFEDMKYWEKYHLEINRLDKINLKNANNLIIELNSEMNNMYYKLKKECNSRSGFRYLVDVFDNKNTSKDEYDAFEALHREHIERFKKVINKHYRLIQYRYNYTGRLLGTYEDIL